MHDKKIQSRRRFVMAGVALPAATLVPTLPMQPGAPKTMEFETTLDELRALPQIVEAEDCWGTVGEDVGGETLGHSDPDHLAGLGHTMSRWMGRVLFEECRDRKWPIEKLADLAHWHRGELKGAVMGLHDSDIRFACRTAVAFGWPVYAFFDPRQSPQFPDPAEFRRKLNADAALEVNA